MKSNYIYSWLIFFGGWLVFGFYPSQFDKSTTEERPLAVVRRFKPNVEVKHSKKEAWTNVKRGEQLFDRDTLVTRENGYAAVQFMDKSMVKVKPNSMLIINGQVDKKSTSSRLALEFGSLFLNVEERQSTFEVATSTAVGTVKGTEFGCIADEQGTTRYWVKTGNVNVEARTSGQKISLDKGMYADINEDGNLIESGTLSQSELNDLINEYEDLDQTTEPNTLKLRFQNSDGELKEIDVKYFENNNQ